MIEELCQRLKDKRKELGIDLEEAVEKTKLHPSVIKAIESGNLASLTPTYIKGFIRIYAGYLRVTIGDELDDVISRREPRLKKAGQRNPPVEREWHFARYLTPQVKKNAVLVAAGIIAFFLIVKILAGITGAIKAFLVRPAREPSRTGQPSVPQMKEPAARTLRSAPLLVSMKFKRVCFIRVKRDGKIVFEGILKAGTVESWDAQEELEFKINDGSCVDVEVNGKLLPPLSKIRQPIKSLTVTPKGVNIEK